MIVDQGAQLTDLYLFGWCQLFSNFHALLLKVKKIWSKKSLLAKRSFTMTSILIGTINNFWIILHEEFTFSEIFKGCVLTSCKNVWKKTWTMIMTQLIGLPGFQRLFYSKENEKSNFTSRKLWNWIIWRSICDQKVHIS